MKTAICAIIKDEHLFLEEWIDWHLGIGFDAIHLFEDKDSKSHKEICEKYSNVYLRRYEEDEQVRLLLAENGNSHRQHVLYEWFAREYKNTYNWVAFIDLDEFIFFGDSYDLDKLCQEFEPYAGVLLNWRMMGANGHLKRPSSVLDGYTKEAVMTHPFETSWWHKSMVNLNRFVGFHNLHRVLMAVNTHHEPTHLLKYYDKAWINHYFTKSWEDWCERIFNRGGTLIGHRKLADFFECNADMLYMMDELISSVADMKPNGTYWLDNNKRLIAGGNVRKINALNKKMI